MIDINNLTVGQIKEINTLIRGSDNNSINNKFWIIGKSYFVRTVTMHIIGILIDIDIENKELIFKDASWIADSGSFHNALKNGTLEEVEPFIDNVVINRESISDATLWNHKVPSCQK